MTFEAASSGPKVTAADKARLVAIQKFAGGKLGDWLEQVADEQYGAR